MLLTSLLFGQVSYLFNLDCEFVDVNGKRIESSILFFDVPTQNMRVASPSSNHTGSEMIKSASISTNLVTFSSKITLNSFSVQPVLINTFGLVGIESKVNIVNCKDIQCLEKPLKSSYAYKGVNYSVACTNTPEVTKTIPDFANKGIIDLGIYQDIKGRFYLANNEFPTIKFTIKGFGKVEFKNSTYASAETIEKNGRIYVRVLKSNGAKCDIMGEFLRNKWQQVSGDKCDFQLF